MDKYISLELDILSCLLQRPELMKEIKFDDRHIIKYKKLWLFMKSIYERYGDFDIVLMTNASQNKYRLMDFIEMLIDREPAPSKFNLYQERLIELFNETKKEKWIKEKIYKLANDLYLGSITYQDFKDKLVPIEMKADKLFKE